MTMFLIMWGIALAGFHFGYQAGLRASREPCEEK
jgi:hypothetical protein